MGLVLCYLFSRDSDAKSSPLSRGFCAPPRQAPAMLECVSPSPPEEEEEEDG